VQAVVVELAAKQALGIDRRREVIQSGWPLASCSSSATGSSGASSQRDA
jgi:hypothetical protein